MRLSCAGYVGYPFQNRQGKSCVENLARDVDKWGKDRSGGHHQRIFMEQIFKVASTGTPIGYGGEFDKSPVKAFRAGCLSLDSPDRPPLGTRSARESACDDS